jgi:glycosyltransferase involved in cell wall biosynthesis
MRVAHFIQRYPPALGGSEAYFARLGRYLVSRGDDVTVFTSNAISLEAFWTSRGETTTAGLSCLDGVQVRRYSLLRWPGRRYLLKGLSLFPHRPWQCLTQPCNPISLAMWRDGGHEALSFGAIHAAAFPYAFPIVCGLRLARQLRVPFLLTPFLHLGDPDDPRDPTRRAYTSPHLRWLLHQADVLFAQTPSERDAMIELGIVPAKIVLQGLGVDPAECTGGNREKARQTWRIGPGEVVIGHLANNSIEKGTNDLLSAAALLWQRGASARVVLAGPEMPNFKTYWNAFAAKDRVVRLGPLSDLQKRDFFAGIDIFALPSRSDSFGLVLLEAWANGVPNVGYRAGGIADVIRHERDGLLVPCGDINGLSLALQKLCQNPELRNSLGTAGRARLTAEFQWDDKLALVRQTMAQL